MELFKDFQSDGGADVRQPFPSSKRAHPPYIPKWDIMPLDKLSQLALNWHAAGLCHEAGQLASVLLSLKRFPYFWSTENRYQEERVTSLFTELKTIPQLDGPSPIIPFSDGLLDGVFTLSGNGTSLGAIRLQEIEIRAIGPQAFPLNDSNRFGIKTSGSDSWVRTFALEEVWMEVGIKKEKGCCINIRFVGLAFDHPMAFVFYVKARNCQVGTEVLQPKSLRSFHGEVQSVMFENGLQIESSHIHKVQVIPLAGEGCFWNTQFLVSFEMHPLQPQASFFIRQI